MSPEEEDYFLNPPPKLKATYMSIGHPKDLLMLLELEAILEWQLKMKSQKMRAKPNG